jgi:hypothetical protein
MLKAMSSKMSGVNDRSNSLPAHIICSVSKTVGSLYRDVSIDERRQWTAKLLSRKCSCVRKEEFVVVFLQINTQKSTQD